MGAKKRRRVRKREVPTDSVPEFELGTQQQIFSTGGGEGGKRKGGGTTTAPEGGGDKEGGGNSGENTLTRGGSCRKKAQDKEK